MDRVKFEPLERADLEDIKALTDLAYEYDQRALGALLGVSNLNGIAERDGGLLSGPEINYDHTNGQITLSSFTFVEFTAGGAPVDSNGNSLSPEARIIRFDSSKSGHVNHPIDISGARAVGTTYTLYARSLQVASDTSARRRWDVNSQSEVSYSPTTRFRERVEFTSEIFGIRPQETTVSGEGQWAPLLTYSIDSTNTFSYTAISALDIADSRAIALQQPGMSLDRITSRDFITASGSQSKNHGLLSLLSAIKLALYRNLHFGQLDTLYTPSASAKWFSAPPLSSEEINLRIQQLETDTQAVEARATDLESVIHALIRVEATWSTSTNVVHLRTDAPQGISLILDGSTMSGAQALGDTALTETDFKKALRRPVVTLPTPASGKSWKLLSHNIIPLLSPSSPDSMTDTSTADNQPSAFNYGIIFGLPSGDIPLSSDLVPTRSLIKQLYSVAPATAPSTTVVQPYAIPFIIRLEPALVSSELKFIYDIQMTLQQVTS